MIYKNQTQWHIPQFELFHCTEFMFTIKKKIQQHVFFSASVWVSPWCFYIMNVQWNAMILFIITMLINISKTLSHELFNRYQANDQRVELNLYIIIFNANCLNWKIIVIFFRNFVCNFIYIFIHFGYITIYLLIYCHWIKIY